MKQSKTVQAIEEDRQFMARLAEANRIKHNPRVRDAEAVYRALYGYLPYDLPDNTKGMMV